MLRLGRQTFITLQSKQICFAGGPSTARLFSTSNGRDVGLYSIPQLQKPTDFSILTRDAIAACNSLRTNIAITCSGNSSTTLTTKSDLQLVLRQLDDISKEICNVIDVTEMCRQTHADASWREAADTAFVKLADYMGILNADPSLYDALKVVTQQASKHDIALDEEDLRLIMLLRAEFERDGIHLSSEDRDHVRELQNTVTEIEGTFNQNIVRNQEMFEVEHVTDVTGLIPHSTLSAMGGSVELDSGGKVKSLSLRKNENALLHTILRYSTSPSARKEMYMAQSTAVPENLSVLGELVRIRHELASKQGFETFTHRYLADKMAGSPENVNKFLGTSLQNNKEQFAKDMKSLASAKQRFEGSNDLEPWDIFFYTELNKAHRVNPLASVSKYLSIDGSVRAMKQLVLELFGITMREESMNQQEYWDLLPHQPFTESTLRKYDFTDSHGEPLGTMYLDLHPRDNKFGHAAHFTLRCGCTLNDGDYQLPIIALVCNLSGDEELHHASVETLYHEFGHALHSLLSRTRYHHVSGTRVAMDFVETPSHLVETFVWDPAFLKILAVDPSTGESIPDQLIQDLRSTRDQYAAIERQNQIVYSMFDQQLFGYPMQETSSDLFERLLSKNGIPFARGTHWYSRFGHLVSYGAGYYSYLYSQVFAANLWAHLFEGQSLSRKSGEKLWRGILMHGGQKDPQQLLDNTLGTNP